MVSIKELKKIQKKQANREIWIHEILDDACLHITRLLIKTPITPNQITFMFVIVGLIGVFLITSPNDLISIGGYLVIFLHWLFDFCDGQVARCKQIFSLKGKYWDCLDHLIAYPFMFLAIGIHLFNKSGILLNLIVGMMTTFFVILTVANQKLYLLIGRPKIRPQEWPPKKIKTLKEIMLRIHKTIRYPLYVVLYFLVIKILTLFPKLKIKSDLIFYSLLFYLAIYCFTFLYQIIDYSNKLDSKNKR